MGFFLFCFFNFVEKMIAFEERRVFEVEYKCLLCNKGYVEG